jgi:hypothetical protein
MLLFRADSASSKLLIPILMAEGTGLAYCHLFGDADEINVEHLRNCPRFCKMLYRERALSTGPLLHSY